MTSNIHHPNPIRKPRITMYITLSVLLLLSGIILHLYREEAYLNMPWIPPTEEDQLFSGQPKLPPPPDEDGFLYTSFSLPFRAKGKNIVDAAGRRFKLVSVNWYGASDELFVPGGLDIRHRTEIARTIRGLGFNSVRLPYSDELVYSNPRIPAERVAANPDFANATALDILVATVTALTDEGIAVILNDHITTAKWCCGADPCNSAWYNTFLPPGVCRLRQSEDQWIENWLTVMSPLRTNRGVIGMDLRNEVRGLWGTMPWAKWAAAAEKAGNALLAMNPDWARRGRRDRECERPVRRQEAARQAEAVRGPRGRYRLPAGTIESCIRPTCTVGPAGAAPRVDTPGASTAALQGPCERTGPTYSRKKSHQSGLGSLVPPISPAWGMLITGRTWCDSWATWTRILGTGLSIRESLTGMRRRRMDSVLDDWTTPILDYRLKDMRKLADGKTAGEQW